MKFVNGVLTGVLIGLIGISIMVVLWYMGVDLPIWRY